MLLKKLNCLKIGNQPEKMSSCKAKLHGPTQVQGLIKHYDGGWRRQGLQTLEYSFRF